MDPNATLTTIRQILADVDQIDRDADRQDEQGAYDVAGDLRARATERRAEVVDYVTALDEWLSAGGFLPDAWTATR